MSLRYQIFEIVLVGVIVSGLTAIAVAIFGKDAFVWVCSVPAWLWAVGCLWKTITADRRQDKLSALVVFAGLMSCTIPLQFDVPAPWTILLYGALPFAFFVSYFIEVGQ